MNPRNPQDDPLLARVAETIAEHQMLASGAPVLAAVSGGADSIALLRILLALGHHVEILHFDHQTREGESTVDAEFVAALARAHQLRFHTSTWDTEPALIPPGASFEMAARAKRYAFFARVARETGIHTLATGHHADDQAETLLMRLLRGASPHGLAGIRPVRIEHGLRIVRPLLSLYREEIHAWLRIHAIAWREDHTNTATDRLRNRVRHEIIPLFIATNPRISAAINRLADTSRIEDDLLEKRTQEAAAQTIQQAQLLREPFKQLHEALQRRVLLDWLHRQGTALGHDRLVEALAFIHNAKPGQRFSLDAHATLHASAEAILRAPMQRPPVATTARELSIPGHIAAFGHFFSARLLEMPEETNWKSWCTPWRQVFDADKLDKTLNIRTRQDGDRFIPFGMQQSKKIQDFLVDQGIPRPLRDYVPLLLSGDEIIWVVGLRAAAQAAVTPATSRILIVEAHPCG